MRRKQWERVDLAENNNSRPRRSKIKILLVDDHPIIREHLGELINRESDLAVCGEAVDASQTLQAIATLKPDIVVLDLSLKGAHGTDLIKNIKIQYPRVPILVLSMYDESLYASRCLRAGARGYVNKQQDSDVVMAAIRHILKGEIYVSEQMSDKILKQFVTGLPPVTDEGIEKLSDRELDTFRMIGSGLSSSEIAAELNVSIKTVETYCKRLKEKLDLPAAPDLHKAAVKWAKSSQIV